MLFLLAGVQLGCAGGSGGNDGTGTPTPTGTATPTPTETPVPTPTPIASACIPDPGAGDHVYDCDGFAYDVHVPAACLAPGCGLIFDVHGFSMSGVMQDANTGMKALGELHGYVVVQPNANPDPPLSGWNPGSDNDKVFAFMQLSMSTWAIDPDRVHMTGFSQGGRMSFGFACAHADVLASIAAAASGPDSGCSFTGAQVPSRQLPILQMHGTQDALVNFTLSGVTQRDAIRTAWGLDAGTVTGSGTGFTRTRYTNAAGAVLEFLQHDYEAPNFTIRGHCFPGSTDVNGGAPGQVFGFACGGAPNGFDWGDEAMAFFLAHPRD